MHRSVTPRIRVLTTMGRVTSKPDSVEAFKIWAEGRKRMQLTIPLSPVPASRPRVSRHAGVYYLKTYATWMKQAALHLPKGDPAFPAGLVAVLVEHFVKRPKTTKLLAPRGDTDNYVKASLDAVTKCGAVWFDDDQVSVLVANKQFEVEKPRTEILVVEL